jgi:hypothetical protein
MNGSKVAVYSAECGPLAPTCGDGTLHARVSDVDIDGKTARYWTTQLNLLSGLQIGHKGMIIRALASERTNCENMSVSPSCKTAGEQRRTRNMAATGSVPSPKRFEFQISATTILLLRRVLF